MEMPKLSDTLPREGGGLISDKADYENIRLPPSREQESFFLV